MDALVNYESSSSSSSFEEEHDNDDIQPDNSVGNKKKLNSDTTNSNLQSMTAEMVSLLPAPYIKLIPPSSSHEHELKIPLVPDKSMVYVASKDYLTEKQQNSLQHVLNQENDADRMKTWHETSSHLQQVANEVFNDQNGPHRNASSYIKHIRQEKDHDVLRNPQLFMNMEHRINQNKNQDGQHTNPSSFLSSPIEEWEYIPNLLALEEKKRINQYRHPPSS
jgi:hypothetical protein